MVKDKMSQNLFTAIFLDVEEFENMMDNLKTTYGKKSLAMSKV